MKRYAGITAGQSEVGILRQEAVAGVDSLSTTLSRYPDQSFAVEVAVASGRGPNEVSDIGRADMQRFAVRLRVHGNRADTHLLAGCHDPQGDFASVGDQHRPKHHRSPRMRYASP